MEIRKHPMGPVPKWGLYFYWGRGITRVGFNRPLYPAHVDASDSEFQKLLLVSELVLSWRAFPQRMIPLSCGCSHNPFFLKEIKAYSSFSHLFSLSGIAPTHIPWYAQFYLYIPRVHAWRARYILNSQCTGCK